MYPTPDPHPPALRPTRLTRRLALLRPVALAALALALALSLADGAGAQTATPMTVERMEAVLGRLDPGMERAGPAFRMTVEDVPLIVITDPAADRMRAMVPIRTAEGLTVADMRRMMQANFDSALDARYAVAEGRLWAVYIHPLSPLRDDQLISGIGQTVNVALTYGSLYSSGGAQFGRGDSRGEQRKLIERLQERGREL